MDTLRASIRREIGKAISKIEKALGPPPNPEQGGNLRYLSFALEACKAEGKVPRSICILDILYIARETMRERAFEDKHDLPHGTLDAVDECCEVILAIPPINFG